MKKILTVLSICIFLAAAAAFAQVSVSLAPFPKQQFFDANGAPISGAPVFSGAPSFTGGGSLAGTFSSDPTLNGNPTLSGNPSFTGSLTVAGNGTGGSIGISTVGSERFDVKAYGAVGDGATDDTTAFKNTIAAANTGTIFVPRGTYLIASALSASKNFIQCAVGATIETTMTSGNLLTFEGHGSVPWGMSNCQIIGPGIDTGATAIQIGNGSGTSGDMGLFINNDIEGFTNGIYQDTSAESFQDVFINNHIKNCTLDLSLKGETSYVAGNLFGSSTNGIYNNSDSTFIGNSFDAITGISFDHEYNGPATLIGNHWENPTRGAYTAYIKVGNSGGRGSLTVKGGLMLDDRASGTQPYMVYDPAGAPMEVDVSLISLGTVVTNVVDFGGHRTYGSRLKFDIPYRMGARFKSDYGNYAGRTNTMDLTGVHSTTGLFPLAGTITLSSGSGSHRFAPAFPSAPICTATDQTSAAAVQVTSTATAITVAGSGSDMVAWICRPATN